MSDSLKTSLLLIALILIWGIGWPVVTLGLLYCPPLWYSAIRLTLSSCLVFIPMGIFRQLILPQKKDIPLLFSIGFIQMGLFVMFITLGLEYVPPGRSAIIAYISPFFVTPIAVLFFGEMFSLGKFIGLVFGAVGIALLFSPWELDWHNKNMLLGNGFLVLAAIAWSIAMIHTRYAKWHRPSHLLLPWQLSVGAITNLIVAMGLNPHPMIHISHIFILSILYTGILASGVAYWIIIVITRKLPVTTTSLLLLAVPVVGLLASALMTHEKLTLSIIISFAFIISGLMFIFYKPSPHDISK